MQRASDPTLTLTLRNRAIAEVNRRFERIRRAVLAAFSLGDYTDKPWPFVDEAPVEGEGVLFGNAAKKVAKKKPKKGYKKPVAKAKPKSVTGGASVLGKEDIPTGYVYQRNERNLHNFDKWLQKLIDDEILEPKVPLQQKWLSKYLGAGYSKGATSAANKARKELKKKGITLAPKHPFTNPAHVERARFIYLRSFNDMEGVTSTMKTQMRRILSEGILSGKNPNDIGKDLADRVDKIGKVRGRLIARTEVVRAHQEAAINEADELEKETGYKINMEWSTCKDGRERETHHARDGKIYTKEAVVSLLGEPNCRCSVNPHISISD